MQEFAEAYSRALYSGQNLATDGEELRDFVVTYRSVRNALVLWRLKTFVRKIFRFRRFEGVRID